MVHLVVLACVLRATTKKVNFFRKKCTPDNILATPVVAWCQECSSSMSHELC